MMRVHHFSAYDWRRPPVRRARGIELGPAFETDQDFRALPP
jgi:hypothetical protein